MSQRALSPSALPYGVSRSIGCDLLSQWLLSLFAACHHLVKEIFIIPEKLAVRHHRLSGTFMSPEAHIQRAAQGWTNAFHVFLSPHLQLMELRAEGRQEATCRTPRNTVLRIRTLWRWWGQSTCTQGLRPGPMCCPPSTSSLPRTVGQCKRQNWRAWQTLSSMLPTCTGSWWRTRRGERRSSRGCCAKLGSTTPISMWRHPGTTSFGATRETPESPGEPCKGTLPCDGWERHSTSTAAKQESSISLTMTTHTAWSCLRRWAIHRREPCVDWMHEVCQVISCKVVKWVENWEVEYENNPYLNS